jgi:hypothetical protein
MMNMDEFISSEDHILSCEVSLEEKWYHGLLGDMDDFMS